MSAVASEEPKGEAPGPQIESQEDRVETVLEYEPHVKVPLAVALVWVCALIGLGAYTVVHLFPDLALWGRP